MTNKKHNHNSTNNTILGIVCVIFVIAIVVVTVFFPQNEITGANYTQYAQVINDRLNILLNNQKDVDNELREIIQSDKYTFEEPYIKVDPYGISPLSAIVIFKTKDITPVKVYVNDELYAEVESSRSHVIPVYGLFNNAKGYLRLVLGNGQSKEFTITTTSLDNNTKGFKIMDHIGNSQNYFLLGSLNSGASVLRGFTSYGVLVSYIDLYYITGIKLRHDHFYVQYNQKNTYGTDLPNLKLEMDYLGKIHNVSEDTSEINGENNVSIGDEQYIGYKYNLSKAQIDNYEIKDVVIENNLVMHPSKTYTSMLSSSLNEAEKYNGELTIIPNGNTITVATNKDNVKAILVEVDGANSYVFNVDNNIIRTDLKGRFIVFLQIDSVVYSTDVLVVL